MQRSRSYSSKYGYGELDVRATYAHLPCQPFWTWLTGKSLSSAAPRSNRECLLPTWKFALNLSKTWAIIFASIALAVHFDNVIVSALAVLFVMNRTRALLHNFHSLSHGSAIANMKLARFAGKYFMSIPIMHLTWHEYLKFHARDHHSPFFLCTDKDPDQQFVIDHGFTRRMSERKFWLHVVVEPFKPRHIWAHVAFRLSQNFVVPGWDEKAPRIAFWAILLGAVTALHAWPVFALYWLLPLFVVTQFSSYVQHVTEHLWFAPPRLADETWQHHVALLTWGRFLGRPYPARRLAESGLAFALRTGLWWAKVAAIDLPSRICVFMQDLSSHDFHHRRPAVSFWEIAAERARSEAEPGEWGPMTETWSIKESMLVVRDHLVHGESDPFGLRARRAPARAVSTPDAQPVAVAS
jgi:hypothetical protein